VDRAQQIGLFRWKIVGEATDVSLSARERGRLVRALAEREHLDPDGRWVRVTRTTLDRWIRAYREGGFDALVPAPRRVANGMPERLELAVALRRERPARTAAQIHRIIVEAEGAGPSARTIQRHLKASGLPWKANSVARAFGRFEAEAPNELWTGDALHGPLIDGRRTFLFCFLDDHSRLLVGYRWAGREDVLNASGALRAGIAARGLPKAVYVDNGSPFVSGQLLRACAVLGIRLIHSTPGRPEGRGKIERVFRTVREQLLVELEDHPPASVEDLNRIFQSWVEQVYHRRAHTETGQTPLERFLTPGVPTRPSVSSLTEAFRWSERRTVSKTGTVGMHGNTYEVDPELAGRQVDLVFDPLELTEVQVRLDGRQRGMAVPRVIKRHVHPRAQPAPEKPAAPTGIDYLGLIQKRREQELQQRIDYRNLPAAGNENEGMKG
jgi:putative transposase